MKPIIDEDHTKRFSDDDLKRLKEMIPHSRAHVEEEGVGGTLCVDADSVLNYYEIFERLLARLEAAEKMADAIEYSKLNWIEKELAGNVAKRDILDAAYKAWRKAAGRD